MSRLRTNCLIVIAGAIALPLVACGESNPAADASSATIVRDSAGIEIREFGAGALAAIPHRVFAPEPDLELGVLEGEEHLQFSNVRAVRTLSDGRIVVANDDPVSIRYFDSDGSFLGQTGRRGEGPGEFGMLWNLAVLPGDSVLVWDINLRRMTVVTPEGTIVREIPMRPAMRLRNYLGPVPGSGFVFYDVGAADSVTYHHMIRIDPAREVADTLRSDGFSRRQVISAGRPDWRAPSLATWPAAVSSGSAIWRTDAGPLAVERLDASGRTEAIFRYSEARVEVTDEYYEWWVDSIMTRIADSWEPELRQNMRDAGRMDSIPALDRVRVGTDGRVWLRRYQPFDPSMLIDGDDWEWLVIEPDGSPVAWVTIPRGFDGRDPNHDYLLEFGPDYVMGVGFDEFGVEYVQRFPLVDAETGESAPGGGDR